MNAFVGRCPLLSIHSGQQIWVAYNKRRLLQVQKTKSGNEISNALLLFVI